MKTGPGPSILQGNQAGDDTAAWLGAALVRSELAWVGRGLLKLLRIKWRERQVKTEHATTRETPLPTGPFRMTRPGKVGDLLLWVPRGIDSYLIDEMTGGYGYSHATIDIGETEIATGKPVMAEITVGQRVTRKFQDEYGRRAYVRVPLRQAGVNAAELARCVESKMGEQYDMMDALTLGEIQDPAKEMCSGLIADCLPDEQLRRIASAQRRGLLHRRSVSVHSRLSAAKIRAFVSPNGLAEYYGAPEGRKIHEPDVLTQPRPADASARRAVVLATRHQGWKLLAAAALVAVVGVAIRRRLG